MVVMFSGLIVHLAIFYNVMSAGHKARLRRMGMSLLAKYWTNRPDHSTGQKVWRVITIHPVGGHPSTFCLDYQIAPQSHGGTRLKALGFVF